MTTNTDTPATSPLSTSDSPRRRWLSIVLALVIFLAGMASGAALAVIVAVNRIQFAIHHPEAAPPRIAAAIARRLDLDDSQRAKVETIVAARQGEIAAIRRQFQPEIVEQLDRLQDEVAGVLEDAQRTRWTVLFEQFRTRWLPPAPPVGAPDEPRS